MAKIGEIYCLKHNERYKATHYCEAYLPWEWDDTPNLCITCKFSRGLGEMELDLESGIGTPSARMGPAPSSP